MEDLRRFLGQSPNIETHLLLTLTTNTKNLLEIYNCYNIMKIHKIIFTKLDECVRFGNVLNLTLGINRPVSYVTTGQNVPDDIEVADPLRLARLILRGIQELRVLKNMEREKKVGNHV